MNLEQHRYEQCYLKFLLKPLPYGTFRSTICFNQFCLVAFAYHLLLSPALVSIVHCILFNCSLSI